MYGKQYEGAHREAASGVGFAAEGINKEKSAETLGLSVNMVTTHLANAERRFREYERYLAQEEKNNQIIDIDLTRGELEMIVYAICEYQQALIRQAHYNVKTDWRGRLPFGASLSQTLSEKIHMKIYGRVVFRSILGEDSDNNKPSNGEA